MTHKQIRHQIASGLSRVLNDSASLPMTPYDYQRETIQKIVSWLENGTSRRGYVSWATGLGKTMLFSMIAHVCVGLRVLIVESGKQLVDQTGKKLVDFAQGKIAHASSLSKIIAPNGDEILRWKNEGDHAIVITTDESFKLNPQRFAEFDPHVIVWDECHWGYTESAQEALNLFSDALIFGFSATPDYLTTVAKSEYVPVTLDNGQILYCPSDRMARANFGDCIDERTIRWGIRNEHLAPLAWGKIEFKFSLNDIPVVKGPAGMDYDQNELIRVLSHNWDIVVATIRKLYQGNQYGLAKRFSAAICPSIQQAQELAEEIRGLGFLASAITANTKDTDREQILAAGNNGEMNLIASVFALREGWDAPNLEVAMILRPTKSRVLYTQFMGRALRKHGDKVALILDAFFQNTNFAPLSAPTLFGEPGQKVSDGGVLVGPARKVRGKSKTSVISPYVLKNAKPILIVQKMDIEHWAGDDGTFEAEGEVWGTRSALARITGLSQRAINRRTHSCRKRYGKEGGGKQCIFYALSDARKACVDLLRKVHQAGKDGTFKVDGETWGTVRAIAQMVGLSITTIYHHISSCRKRKGKERGGKLCNFYVRKDVKKACNSLLREVAKVGSDGTLKIDGETWGTALALARIIGLWPATMKSQISSCQKKEGKNNSGLPCTLYALSEVKLVCASLLKEVPKTGNDGTFNADGEVWGTINVLAKIVGLSSPTIKKRISSCQKKEGKNNRGLPCTLYALSDAKKVCADLLVRKKQL